MSRTRMTTLSLLLSALSPFVIFDSIYALILCLLCKSDTLLNIFMLLGRNVEQDKIISSFVLFLKLILCWVCNSNILQNILMIFSRNEEQDKIRFCVQE